MISLFKDHFNKTSRVSYCMMMVDINAFLEKRPPVFKLLFLNDNMFFYLVICNCVYLLEHGGVITISLFF